MSVAKLKKALTHEIDIITKQLLQGNVDDFSEYRFVVGQAYAYRNTLQIIKDITDGNQKSRSGDVTSED